MSVANCRKFEEIGKKYGSQSQQNQSEIGKYKENNVKEKQQREKQQVKDCITVERKVEKNVKIRTNRKTVNKNQKSTTVAQYINLLIHPTHSTTT